jgi:hypothetical protein
MFLKQLAYKTLNAPLRTYPYPHVFVPEVFPAEVYAEIQRNIPDPAAMIPIEQARPIQGYKERFVQDISGPMEGLTEAQRGFWQAMAAELLGGGMLEVMVNRFRPFIDRRFQGASIDLRDESLLVEDITNYALGPHTDAPSKVVTVLFYLPRDNSQAHLGTSIYSPKDPTGRCPGGPHYPFEGFDRVATMPFLPNSMFAFVKSDVAFHGVEPVKEPDVRRWLLLYDIKARPAASTV